VRDFHVVILCWELLVLAQKIKVVWWLDSPEYNQQLLYLAQNDNTMCCGFNQDERVYFSKMTSLLYFLQDRCHKGLLVRSQLQHAKSLSRNQQTHSNLLKAVHTTQGLNIHKISLEVLNFNFILWFFLNQMRCLKIWTHISEIIWRYMSF